MKQTVPGGNHGHGRGRAQVKVVWDSEQIRRISMSIEKD